MIIDNVKMIVCSNPKSEGMREINEVHSLNIDKQFIFGSIMSSRIRNISFSDEQITISTLNTVYEFVEINKEEK